MREGLETLDRREVYYSQDDSVWLYHPHMETWVGLITQQFVERGFSAEFVNETYILAWFQPLSLFREGKYGEKAWLTARLRLMKYTRAYEVVVPEQLEFIQHAGVRVDWARDVVVSRAKLEREYRANGADPLSVLHIKEPEFHAAYTRLLNSPSLVP